MAKVRITFKAISDEKQIMNQPQANQPSIFMWPLFSYRLRYEHIV